MLLTIIFIIIAAFADVIGGALTIVKRFKAHEILIISGLGTGFLLGATLLDRLPDAMEQLPHNAPIFIIIGYLLILLIERMGRHSHHGTHEINHSVQKNNTENLFGSKASLTTFIALLFHTFMDGIILAGAFSFSRASGILIFLAITLHKIPEGFSMASISLASGTSRKRAFIASTALGISTLLGALVTLELGVISQNVVAILMALATGTFLYVSTTDMVPSFRNQSMSGIIFIVIGVVIFYITLILIQHSGLE